MNEANSGCLADNRLLKAIAVSLILGSLLVQIAVISLGAGYGNAPQGLIDSSGNKLGFNDPLTNQHIRMLITSVSVAEFVQHLNILSAGCLMAHLVGMALLLNKERRWVAQGFFLFQPVVFFYGSIGLVVWPMSWGHRLTGESIVEGPLSDIFSSATWILVSLSIGLWLAMTNNRALKPQGIGNAISFQ